MFDLKGDAIEIGSQVAYFQGGRYDSVNICVVLEIRKKVKVEYVKSSRNDNVPGYTTWADWDRLVVL